MKIVSFVIPFLITAASFAQPASTVSIKIDDLAADRSAQIKGYLVGYDIYEKFLVDSAYSTGNTLKFSLPPNTAGGMYDVLLTISDSASKRECNFKIILNNTDVSLHTTIEKTAENMEVLVSEENRVWYDFLKKKSAFEKKKQVISQALQQLPEMDDLYKGVQKNLQDAERKYEMYSRKLVKSKSRLLASQFIRWSFAISPLTKNGLSNFDFNNNLLKHSGVLQIIAWNYLYLYKNDSLNPVQQQDVLIEAIDTLMAHFNMSRELVSVASRDFASQFERMGMDKVVMHITERYLVAESCSNPEEMALVKDKIERLRKVAVGQPAPDIVLNKENLFPRTLYEINARRTLVVFYASTCEHCRETMPDLINLYHRHSAKDFEVLAVSVDTSKKEWMDFVMKNNFDWINFSELKGWQGENNRNYNVVSTPTMVLLDENKKIMAKPFSVDELERLLDK